MTAVDRHISLDNPFSSIAMAKGVAGAGQPVRRASREDFRRREVTDLDGAVLADTFEAKLAKFYQAGPGTNALLVDFRSAEFIDIAALVNCVSAVLDREERGLLTRIGLPARTTVLDFLRVWRFPEAIEQATRKPFKTFVLESDHSLLNTEQATYTGVGGALDLLEYDPDWTPHSTAPRNFFGFLTLSHSSGRPIQPDADFAGAPREASKRWTSPLIQQVLRRHLGDSAPHDDVARVIVYEAIGNAVRHPEATLIQTVSKFSRREPALRVEDAHEQPPERVKPVKPEGALRICIWDNGRGIAETLKPLVAAGRSIRRLNLPMYMCDKIHVQLRTFDEKVTRTIIVDQSEDISVERATEAHLLLASLYPGVSRNVDQSVPPVEPFETHDQKEAATLRPAAPGMGLYALARTVLDQFQGQLFIRSGKYRLVMEVAHDAYRKQYGVRYKAKITQYPDFFPPFRGNLLTLNLPIGRQTHLA